LPFEQTWERKKQTVPSRTLVKKQYLWKPIHLSLCELDDYFPKHTRLWTKHFVRWVESVQSHQQSLYECLFHTMSVPCRLNVSFIFQSRSLHRCSNSHSRDDCASIWVSSRPTSSDWFQVAIRTKTTCETTTTCATVIIMLLPGPTSPRCAMLDICVSTICLR